MGGLWGNHEIRSRDMGVGERRTVRKDGKVTRSRTITVYVDEGERYPDGRKKYKQVRKTVKARTRAEAWKSYVEREEGLRRVDVGPVRLSEWYDRLIEEKKLEGRGWKHYARFKRYHVAYFGDIVLDDLTTEECRKYKNKRLADGISYGAVDHEFAVLKHVIMDAMNAGRTTHTKNPVTKKIFINKTVRRERVLSTLEQGILFALLSDRDRRLCETMVNCGPRPGEAAKIKKKWVDLDNNTLKLVETKGLKPREIPFGPLQRRIFIEAIEDSPPESELVFVNNWGRPYVMTHFDVVFKKTCESAGITGLVPHCLRHTFATRLCRSNVNLRKVQYYMGHSDIRTTERYTHIDLDFREDVLIAESFTRKAREMSQS